MMNGGGVARPMNELRKIAGSAMEPAADDRRTAAEAGIRDLLRATLRHRPDRIILGEVRGGEAFDLLQALNTGHSGTLSTIHANSAQQALARFTSCVLQSGVELPYAAVRRNIGDAVHLLLHLERRQGRRYVAELVRVQGFDPDSDSFRTTALYSTE